MTTYIAGHKLTHMQRTVLDVCLDHVRQYGEDSHMGPHTRPKGDGRWIPSLEIFPARNNHHASLRRVVRKLASMGVLSACDIEYRDDCLRGFPTGAASKREPGEEG
jgi:hypothetical protein